MGFELAGRWREALALRGHQQTSATWHFAGQLFSSVSQRHDGDMYLARITAAQDESLQLSLCRKHCKNYCSYFIGLGSQGLNELSKATQRASGKAGSTPCVLSALRSSSQTTLCLKGSHSTTLWLVYMFKWKTNCSFFVFICTSNICPDF